jgi:hypothetical protein
MQPRTPCTDHFRAEHTSVRCDLDAIEAGLALFPGTDDLPRTREALWHLLVIAALLESANGPDSRRPRPCFGPLSAFAVSGSSSGTRFDQRCFRRISPP